MTDHFAALNEPRRPWMNPDALKQKFLELSAQFHPDRVHQLSEPERRAASDHFTEINSAFNCLREAKDRLRHLLELELGAKPVDIQPVPREMMDSLFEVGEFCGKVDAFLLGYAQINSPMLKIQQFERGQEWINQLTLLKQKIALRQQELIMELQSMNAFWEETPYGHDAPPKPLQRLDAIYRLLGYLGRWSCQIHERFVQLSITL